MIKRPTKRNATRALRYAKKYWEAHDNIAYAHRMLHKQCNTWDIHTCTIGEQDVCPFTTDEYGNGYLSVVNWINEWERSVSLIEGCDGFRMLGSGSYRTAILGPDGYVYKVGSEYHNRNEFNAYNALSERIAGEAFKIAECTLFEVRNNVIAAMPLVQTVASKLTWDWQYQTINEFVIERMKQFIDDMHDDNWGVDEDGWIVVFDYGFSDSNGEKTTDW